MNYKEMEEVISAIDSEHVDRFFKEVEDAQIRKKMRIKTVFRFIAPAIVLVIAGAAAVLTISLSNRVKAKPMNFYLKDHPEITLTIADGRYRISGSGPLWKTICNVFAIEGPWAPSLIMEGVYYSGEKFTYETEEEGKGFAFTYTENGISIARTPSRNWWLNFLEIDGES